MTKIFNKPSDVAEEAFAGFCDVHSGLVRQAPGGAVRRHRPPRVSEIIGYTFDHSSASADKVKVLANFGVS